MSGACDTFLERVGRTTVLVIGDVMMDAYLWGRVDRISPEAPVPVVQVTSRSARLGGAANVALNLKALGAAPIVVSTIGADEQGAALERLFAEQGLRTDGLLRSATRLTTVKTRVISNHQHVVRVDEEQEDDLSAAEESTQLARIEQLIAAERPAVMVLEDYDKGVLTATGIAAIIAAAHKAGAKVAVDPKKRNFLAYHGVDLFKPNLKELREGLKVDTDPADDASLHEAATVLRNKLGNTLSLITLSERGTYMHEADGAHRVPAHRRKIADVSGAGDTVIAVAALALAQGMPPLHIAQLANLAGGLVCEEVGVAPIDPERFRAECQRLQLPG